MTAGDPIERLVAGSLDRVAALADGRLDPSAPAPSVLMPGSFNPVHDGHRLLARVAEEILQAPVCFEISVVNVDKPPLAADEVRARVAQFVPGARVELTRAPTFLEKARLFRRVTFVVGVDTAERLVAPRYYAGDEARMVAALREIAGLGCRFLVAVRVDATLRVRALADVPVPAEFAELFTAIPESRFRLDVSSSEIRARRRAAP